MKMKDFFNNLKGNPSVKKTIQRISYFWNNFWPSTVVIVTVIFSMFIINYYNSRFHTDKITKFINRSNYAGNAVFINKRFLLTNNSYIDKVCKMTSNKQRLRVFIVSDGQAFKVDIIDRDENSDLMLLSINQGERRFTNINNFVIFPNVPGDRYNYIDTDAYISRNINDSDKIFYRKYRIKNISNVGFSVKSKDILRKNFGEVVINDRHEFIGLTAGNTAKNLRNIFSNEINIIDDGKIKNFLKRNNVYYYKNINNIDLRTVANYRKSIGAKVICYVQDPLPQKVIQMYKY